LGDSDLSILRYLPNPLTASVHDRLITLPVGFKVKA